MAKEIPVPEKSGDNLTVSIPAVDGFDKTDLAALIQELSKAHETLDEVHDPLPACDLSDEERRLAAKLIRCLNGYDEIANRILGLPK